MNVKVKQIDKKMLIVCGPSGVGKSTLIEHLMHSRNGCKLSRSCTTRAPRGVEKDGIEYDFITVKDFEERIAQNAFAEYANVFGNYYGTPHQMIHDIVNEYGNILFDIDVQGAQQLRNNYPNAWLVLIAPPSLEILEKRLRARKTDAEDAIQRRLAEAKNELAQSPIFDFILHNDDLDEAKRNILAIYDSLLLRNDQ